MTLKISGKKRPEFHPAAWAIELQLLWEQEHVQSTPDSNAFAEYSMEKCQQRLGANADDKLFQTCNQFNLFLFIL